MTLRGHKNYYNVKLLRGYGASISLRNKKVCLKGGKDIFTGQQEKARPQCNMGYIAGALSNNPRADIIIYHKGDIGKEPMIITVFGKNPGKVAAKIKEILKNYWTLLAAPE